MAENMGKWASGNRKIAKSGHRVAAEMIPFPRRWHGGMISANPEAIWGMSDEAMTEVPRNLCQPHTPTTYMSSLGRPCVHHFCGFLKVKRSVLPGSPSFL